MSILIYKWVGKLVVLLYKELLVWTHTRVTKISVTLSYQLYHHPALKHLSSQQELQNQYICTTLKNKINKPYEHSQMHNTNLIYTLIQLQPCRPILNMTWGTLTNILGMTSCLRSGGRRTLEHSNLQKPHKHQFNLRPQEENHCTKCIWYNHNNPRPFKMRLILYNLVQELIINKDVEACLSQENHFVSRYYNCMVYLFLANQRLNI